MHTEKNLRLTSKIADEAELEHDLEIWRHAYSVALSGMCSGPDIVDPIVVSPVIARLADLALDAYREKREEMGR